MLGLFQPTEIRGRNTRKLGCLNLCFKNFPYIKKNKTKNTKKLFAQNIYQRINITGVNVVMLQFFYINTCCLDFTVFLFVVFLSKIKKSLNICVAFHKVKEV